VLGQLRTARPIGRVASRSIQGRVEAQILLDARDGAGQLLAAAVGRSTELGGNGRPIRSPRP